jgi:hypothetical protein
MRHIRVLSHQRPARAQLEPVIQLLGVINSLVGIVSNLLFVAGQMLDLLGIDPQDK